MKHLNFLFLVLMLIVSSALVAQTDNFNYQAAIRDASGEVMQNDNVTIVFSIRSNSASGTEVYTETHNATTNDQGLVNLSIGSGTVGTGNFAAIDWSSNSHFLNVEVNGTDMGTLEFKSVPYANYAQTAGNVFSGDYNDLINTPTTGSSAWSQNGDTIFTNNDRVAVGSNSPRHKFYVLEDNPFDGVMSIENSDTNGFAGSYFYSGGANKGYVGHVGSGFWCESNSFQVGSIGGADIVLMSSSCSADLTVKANSGEVGIGTRTPLERLHVNGRLRVEDLSSASGTQQVFADADGVLTTEAASGTVRSVPVNFISVDSVFWTHPDYDIKVAFNPNTEVVTIINDSGNYFDVQITGYASSNTAPAAQITAVHDVPGNSFLSLDLGAGTAGGFTITSAIENNTIMAGFTMNITYYSDDLRGLISIW